MKENAYNLLVKNNVNIEEGIKKYGGNFDLYMIFLKRFFQQNEIQDLSYLLQSDDIEQCVFCISSLLTESEELGIVDVSNMLNKIRKHLENKELKNAKQTFSLLIPKYMIIKQIVNS